VRTNPFAGVKPGLAAFIHNVPPDATVLFVRYVNMTAGMSESLTTKSAAQVAAGNASEMADHVMLQCADWTESQGIECSFVAQWLDAAKEPLATHRWKLGGVDDASVPFNGTAESIIAQQQGHNHVLVKMLIDSQAQVARVQKELLEMTMNRVRLLERKTLGMEDEVQVAREIAASVTDPALDQEERRWHTLISMGKEVIKQLGPNAGNGSNGSNGSGGAKPTPATPAPEAPPSFDPGRYTPAPEAPPSFDPGRYTPAPEAPPFDPAHLDPAPGPTVVDMAPDAPVPAPSAPEPEPSAPPAPAPEAPSEAP